MAHFLSKTIGTFVLAAALPLLQGQTIRPAMPGQRPNQPARPNQPVNVSPQPSQPAPPAASGTPTPAVGVPSQPAQPAMQPGPSGPPVAPVVTFRDGLLTVQALNSNLSSVVTAIRNKAGIEFEGAENANERVAISIGPAPEGDVLAAIFAGSKYDFLAVGRADSPAIVQRVILTVKNKPGTVAAAPAQPAPANQGEEEEVPEEQVNNGDPQDTQVQPVPVPQQPAQAETPPNQQPKSPEQLLQELQQMRRDKGSPEDPTNNPNPAPRKQPPQ
ncbi:MAG: hypothetical protein JWN42_2889 [Candidatus Angelobacter sp.]|nr:hypothetical protein [Candidatus Angelobacter sp.]